MTKPSEFVINFADFGGPIHAGRPKGAELRKRLKLDQREKEYEKIIVNIPENTWSVNSSFFLGLFGDSIKKKGSAREFLSKYYFNCSPEIQETIEGHIQLGLLEIKFLVRG